MKIKLQWINVPQKLVIASLMSKDNVEVRQYDLDPQSVDTFIVEYLKYMKTPIYDYRNRQSYYPETWSVEKLNTLIKTLEKALEEAKFMGIAVA